MLALIKELFGLLTPKQKRHFFFLQIAVAFMSVFELIGIALVAPFIAIASDFSLIDSTKVVRDLYIASKLSTHGAFVMVLGVSIVCFLGVSALVSSITTWLLAMFAASVGTEIGDRLFRYYLGQRWLFHTSISSSVLTKNIATEAVRVSDFIIQPLMQMNAKVVLVFVISLSLLLYQPGVSLIAIAIFSISYLILYKTVRLHLQANGTDLSRHIGKRFYLMNESFGGIKEVILSGNGNHFVEEFDRVGSQFARARGVNAGLSQVPRYLMEFIAFGSIIGLILFLLAENDNKISAALPVLSIYAFASLKLLPAIQQIYVNLSQVKGNLSAFDTVKYDLDNAVRFEGAQCLNGNLGVEDALKIKYRLNVDNLSFEYEKGQPVLRNVSLEVLVNQTIGIVGPSGSGKSTLIDVLLGLIDPDEGSMSVDGVEIAGLKSKRAWQNSIGYVPQSVFLTEASILENIAFGVPREEIDLNRVDVAVKLAHLADLVARLPDGLRTEVGERGVQLSGGQRQRVAIARALYFDVDVIVFDEATSALDGVSEKKIMDAIHDFHGSKTIIMIAHRLKTVERCDTIFLLERGAITDQGSYSELVSRNEEFRRMSNLA